MKVLFGNGLKKELIKIMDSQGLNPSEEKEFDKVGTIIEKYEEIHFPIDDDSLKTKGKI